MSEKLVEIGRANSKGYFSGIVDEDKISISFKVPRNPDFFVGFRFLWREDKDLLYKGFLNYSKPSLAIGFWIRDIDWI